MRLPFFPKSDDLGRLLLRLAVGGIILFHGVFKLQHGVAWIAGPLGQVGLPGFLAYGTYVAEVVAPVLIILGMWTRPAALLVAFDMFMAVALVLRGQLFSVKEAGGGWGVELEALLLLGALALVFLGAGRYRVRHAESALD
jgi:putative oxidoreductase